MPPPDPVTAVSPLLLPEIVSVPARPDAVTARRLGSALLAAFRPGVAVVIADMSRTEWCDAAWTRRLLAAHRHAVARDAEFRVVPSEAVLTALRLAGLEEMLRVYPTMTAALTGAPQPRCRAELPVTAAATGQEPIRVWSSGLLAIVTTPAEVGSENAQDFWAALAEACASHAVSIADMTGTQRCGYDAATALLMALRCTDASGGELWLAVSAAVGKLLSATAVGGVFPTFGGLGDALAALAVRRPDLL